MVIKVKNKKLKSRVFKSIRRYENLALKSYSKGNMKTGKKYEKKSDQLYAKNYNKMFEVVKKRRKK